MNIARALLVLFLGFLCPLTSEVSLSEAQIIDEPPPLGSILVSPDAAVTSPDDLNVVEFPTRCLAIVTDLTVKGDAAAINAAAQDATIIEDCSGWQDVDNRMSCVCYQDPFNGLIISGHGSVQGGVKASEENLVSSNVSEQFIESLDSVLTADAPIFILGCGQGMREEQMQSFANQTGHPVVANTGCTYDGDKGSGDWITFYPLSWHWRAGWLTADVYREDRLVQ